MLLLIVGIVGAILAYWGLKRKHISGVLIVGGLGLLLMFFGLLFSFIWPWSTSWHEENSEEIFAMECFTDETSPVYVIEGNGFWIYGTSKTVDFERAYNMLEAEENVEIIEGFREKYELKEYSDAPNWLFSFAIDHKTMYVFYVPEGSVIN